MKENTAIVQHKSTSTIEALSVGFIGIGLIILTISFLENYLYFNLPHKAILLFVSLFSLTSGIIGYGYHKHIKSVAGINNSKIWKNSISSKGILAWLLGIILTSFYILLYWFPSAIGLGETAAENSGLVALFDPLSQFFKGQNASQWFVYGTLYTVLIIAFGVKFLFKYRHDKYQTIRTTVVIFSQLFFAYLIPEILEGFSDPNHYFAKDIKNVWPLNYYFFEDWHLNNMLNEGGSLGQFYFYFGLLMFLIVTPVLTYYVGKRWYCSWICGCGGLAETAGDSFRQLSDKSITAWKLEKILIYSILLLVFIMTGVSLYGYMSNSSTFLGLSIYTFFIKPYGFLIGSAFSGVIGVGFYPLLGNRVWCRFGCPMAAYMGIFQRFKSKFRITTNGGQCISCGNCSTYCEQGIDVRAYAQKGQNIVRASCVGCGICSSVCPRGVLKLENGPEESRIKEFPKINGKQI